MPRPSSELNIKLTMKPARSREKKQGIVCCLLQDGFLLGLVFNPEDGGCMFLPNVG
jgi:hypothetical protein